MGVGTVRWRVLCTDRHAPRYLLRLKTVPQPLLMRQPAYERDSMCCTASHRSVPGVRSQTKKRLQFVQAKKACDYRSSWCTAVDAGLCVVQLSDKHACIFACGPRLLLQTARTQKQGAHMLAPLLLHHMCLVDSRTNKLCREKTRTAKHARTHTLVVVAILFTSCCAVVGRAF